jgi:putative transposase
VATSYLLGVSTRRVEKLAETLGITGLSRSQVSSLAKSLDGAVEEFRSRPLDAGPYRFVPADALVVKVREGGRTVNVHALIATGVNAGGKREIPGFEVTSAEDGAGWLAFFRGLTARGLSGVVLVTSGAHAGLVAAIAATLPGASWQRCRTHYLRDLLTKVSKSSQPWVATLVRTIFDQPDAAEVGAQFSRVADALDDKSRPPPGTWRPPGTACWPSPACPGRSGGRPGPPAPRNGSTASCAAGPTPPASSPAATPSSASQAPCSWSRTTSGPGPAATWAWTCSPRPARRRQPHRPVTHPGR